MDPIVPSVSEADFAHLVRRAGLDLDADQRRVLHEVYGHFEAMLGRVRGRHGRDRARGAEPAHVFVPSQGWGAR